jgi:hypothetical protein
LNLHTTREEQKKKSPFFKGGKKKQQQNLTPIGWDTGIDGSPVSNG